MNTKTKQKVVATLIEHKDKIRLSEGDIAMHTGEHPRDISEVIHELLREGKVSVSTSKKTGKKIYLYRD